MAAKGITVDLVSNENAATWNYSNCDLIIIGSDTYSEPHEWQPSAAVSVINDSQKPILGLGLGGTCFFGKLNLYIGWPQASGGTKQETYVVDPTHPIFRYPKNISIPMNGTINLYELGVYCESIYLPSPIPKLACNVTPIGRESDDINHYPLILEGNRYFLWGFATKEDISLPYIMTSVGKDLFVNIVLWLMIPPPVAEFRCDPDSPLEKEEIVFDASKSVSSQGKITVYEWNFGDGNTATVAEPTMDHSYLQPGKYNVTLKVTDNSALWNITSRIMTVYYETDFNRDGKVNVQDITVVAVAYGSRRGDPKWNSTADLDQNGIINIIDITMVAKDYGKTAAM